MAVLINRIPLRELFFIFLLMSLVKYKSGLHLISTNHFKNVPVLESIFIIHSYAKAHILKMYIYSYLKTMFVPRQYKSVVIQKSELANTHFSIVKQNDVGFLWKRTVNVGK